MLRDRNGGVCLLGAIRAANGIEERMSMQEIGETFPDHAAAVIAAIPADEVTYRGEFKDITIQSWNDRSERTFDDVLRVAKVADEIVGSVPVSEETQ